MYCIRYTTKEGGSGIQTSSIIEPMIRKAIRQFKSKLPATVYENGEVIGRVFEDSSCRTGWNWYVKTEKS